MSDNTAILAGFTEEFIGTNSKGETIHIFVKPGTDLSGSFRAYDADFCRWIFIYGPSWSFDSCVTLGETTMSEPRFRFAHFSDGFGRFVTKCIKSVSTYADRKPPKVRGSRNPWVRVNFTDGTHLAQQYTARGPAGSFCSETFYLENGTKLLLNNDGSFIASGIINDENSEFFGGSRIVDVSAKVSRTIDRQVGPTLGWFLIINFNAGMPTVEWKERVAAENEAIRLSEMHKGPFAVLEVTSALRMQPTLVRKETHG